MMSDDEWWWVMSWWVMMSDDDWWWEWNEMCLCVCGGAGSTEGDAEQVFDVQADHDDQGHVLQPHPHVQGHSDRSVSLLHCFISLVGNVMKKSSSPTCPVSCLGFDMRKMVTGQEVSKGIKCLRLIISGIRVNLRLGCGVLGYFLGTVFWIRGSLQVIMPIIWGSIWPITKNL